METRAITNEEVLELTISEHKDFAQQMQVNSEVSLHEAGELLVTIKRLMKETESWFKPMVDAAFAAHRTICARKNQYIKPLQEAEEDLKRKIGTFQMELDRIRYEEERKAREKADKEAEAERKKLMAKAEKQEAKGNTEGAQELLQAAADVRLIQPRHAPEMPERGHQARFTAAPQRKAHNPPRKQPLAGSQIPFRDPLHRNLLQPKEIHSASRRRRIRNQRAPPL